MRAIIKLRDHVFVLVQTLRFLKRHVAIITTLGLIAAFGRVVQSEGFGNISPTTHTIAELVVETSRVLLLLFVLGLANIKNGVIRIVHFFTKKAARRSGWLALLDNLLKKWPAILVNFVCFAIVAWGLNALIDAVAYQTCLLLSLKELGILQPGSGEWAILLFFKNLSVIPFTLVFETIFLLWITGRLQRLKFVS